MTTIVAAFEDRHAAHRALVELAHSGFSRDDLHVEHDVESLRASGGRRRPGTDTVLSSVGRMFADLVRTNVNHHQVDVVTDALERGASVLVARISDPTMTDREMTLRREAGAFKVGTHAAADVPH
jgi:hypothetical protein